MMDKIASAGLIGHVGSPSTSIELKVNLEEHAYATSLVGNFCVIPYTQDAKKAFSIGQIVSIELSNPYLERHSVEKIISIRGDASPLTKEHDVINVVLGPSSTYTITGEMLIPSTLATIPPTGTPVYLLNQEIVNDISLRSKAENVAYLGRMYNSEILLPVVLQDFSESGTGGAGEGYHIGVFGKSGSGKSYLTRMIILAYARYINMALLCIDAIGEYAKELLKNGTMHKLILSLGRTYKVYGVSQISLATENALERILLASGEFFLDRMGVRAEENRINAARVIATFFSSNKKITLPSGEAIASLPYAHEMFVFKRLLSYIETKISSIYVSQEGRNRVLDAIKNEKDQLFEAWLLTANLFSSTRTSLTQIISELYSDRKIIVIDLSESSATGIYWNERIRAVVVDEIVKSLNSYAEKAWRGEDKLVNTLVMIDEAHRLVPRESSQVLEVDMLRQTLIRMSLETRKFGLGWMFISPSIAGLHPEILRQMRLYFFGYGLSWGVERHALEELVGRGKNIQLYSSFKDPQTSALLGKKEYPFMVYGPVSPLSISGDPIFFNTLDYGGDFIQHNFGAVNVHK